VGAQRPSLPPAHAAGCAPCASSARKLRWYVRPSPHRVPYGVRRSRLLPPTHPHTCCPSRGPAGLALRHAAARSSSRTTRA
jgi:hypothetical protein